MLFGNNPKKMFNLILEFIETRKDIPPEKTPEIKGVEGFFHVTFLAIIAEDFIINKDSKKEKIFDAISDSYNEKNGIRNFITLTRAMEKEKNLGFKNMALLMKNLEEKQKSLVN